MRIQPAECGTPVEDSLWRYRLRYADPTWVRRLAHGLGCIELAVIVLTVGLMIVGGSPLFPLFALASDLQFLWVEHLDFLGAPLTLAAFVFWALGIDGIRSVCGPVPDTFTTPSSEWTRKAARYTGIVAWLLTPVGLAVVLEARAPGVVCFGSVCMLAAVGGVCLLMTYFGYLSARLPDRSLLAQWRLVAGWTAVVWIIKISVTNMDVLIRHGVLPGMSRALTQVNLWTCTVHVFAFLAVVLAIWTMVLAEQLRRRLLEASALAAETQAAGSTASESASVSPAPSTGPTTEVEGGD